MTVNNTIAHQRLILSGDRERYTYQSFLYWFITYITLMKRFSQDIFNFRFKELLRRRLIECGWRDQVRMLCRDMVKENDGGNVTFDMLVNRVTPRARALVPDPVKKELLQKIKTHLLTQKDQ